MKPDIAPLEEVRSVTLVPRLDDVLRDYSRYAYQSHEDSSAESWVIGSGRYLQWLQHPVGVDVDDDDAGVLGELVDASGDRRNELLDEIDASDRLREEARRGISVPHPLDDVTGPDVDNYLLWLAQTAYAFETKDNYNSALHDFYDWAERRNRGDNLADGYTIHDHTVESGALDEDQRRTDEDSDIRYISADKVRRLWQPENIPEPRVRNELAIKILWHTGMRCKALSEIELDDVLFEEGRIVIPYLKRYSNDDPGYRTVEYPRDRLDPLLREWIDHRRGSLGSYHDESDKLLLTREQGYMRPGHISRKVKQAAENAGIQQKLGVDARGNDRWLVTGHCIRHSAITYWANECPSLPLAHIKSQAGHKDLATTQRYIHEDLESRKAAYSEMWS